MNDASQPSGPTLAQKGRLMNLSFRQREILILRLGLFSGDPPRSAEEVGAIFKIATARVREIELSAMEKLKALLGRDEVA